jgi:hypothetical protein
MRFVILETFQNSGALCSLMILLYHFLKSLPYINNLGM